MLVKAKQGARCPKEGKPREYIDDQTAVDVPETAYYHNLLNDGSLEKHNPAEQSSPSVSSPLPSGGEDGVRGGSEAAPPEGRKSKGGKQS